MRLQRVEVGRFKEIFPTPSHIYNRTAFTELNKHKAYENDVQYLTFDDDGGKTRLGLILGARAESLVSPFSAPFGGFEEKGSQRLKYYMEAAHCLGDYAKTLGKMIKLTLPPPIYSLHSHIYKQQLAMLSCGAEIGYIDYNCSFDLGKWPSVGDIMWPNVRRNLSTSLKFGLDFEIVAPDDLHGMSEVYETVRINHQAHGYPVHMSMNDILDTVHNVRQADFFLVKSADKTIASAMVYVPADKIAQLIYWGDIPEARHMRPMNFLAYNLLEHYWRLGFRWFDFGPSSSDGIPSVGLYDFKESFGCELFPKTTIILRN